MLITQEATSESVWRTRPLLFFQTCSESIALNYKTMWRLWSSNVMQKVLKSAIKHFSVCMFLCFIRGQWEDLDFRMFGCLYWTTVSSGCSVGCLWWTAPARSQRQSSAVRADGGDSPAALHARVNTAYRRGGAGTWLFCCPSCASVWTSSLFAPVDVHWWTLGWDSV